MYTGIVSGFAVVLLVKVNFLQLFKEVPTDSMCMYLRRFKQIWFTCSGMFNFLDFF